MKKVIKILLLVGIMTMSLALFACSNASVTKIEVSKEQVTIEYDSVWDINQNISIKAIMSDGKEMVVENTACIFTAEGVTDFTNISKKPGTYLVNVKYQGVETTFTLVVNAKVDNGTYTVIDVLDPSFIAKNDNNKSSFDLKDGTYKVGSENPFKYDLRVEVMFDYDLTTGTVTNYDLAIELEKLEGTSYVAVSNLSDYATVDARNHTIQFKENAVGNKFNIKASVVGDDEEDHVSEFKFEVVKGYNVYNAADLSVIDNCNANGKWTALKTQNGLLDVTTDRIILQSDITVKAEDLPSVHFFKEDEVNENDKDVLWGDPIVGSLKDGFDEELGFLYSRRIEYGKTFDFEGNYYQVDFSNLPYMYRERKNSVLEIRETKETAITVHTSVFNFFTECIDTGVRAVKTDVPQVNIENLLMFGNAQKSSNVSQSGGILGIKIRNVNSNVKNNTVKSTYVAYLTEGKGDYYANYENKFYHVNMLDSFQTLLYVWGSNEVCLDSCKLIGAGGPAIITDHVSSEPGDDPYGGFPSNVYVDTLKEEGEPATVIESKITGEEGWFQTYEGSSALVGFIKALEPYFNNYGKTILDETDTKVNIVAVYKSSSAQGLTTNDIKGTFNLGDHTSLDFDNATLNYMIGQIRLSGQMGLVIGSCNAGDTSTFGMPGTSGWVVAPDQTLFYTSERYAYIYLSNGMAAVIAMENLPQ